MSYISKKVVESLEFHEYSAHKRKHSFRIAGFCLIGLFTLFTVMNFVGKEYAEGVVSGLGIGMATVLTIFAFLPRFFRYLDLLLSITLCFIFTSRVLTIVLKKSIFATPQLSCPFSLFFIFFCQLGTTHALPCVAAAFIPALCSAFAAEYTVYNDYITAVMNFLLWGEFSILVCVGSKYIERISYTNFSTSKKVARAHTILSNQEEKNKALLENMFPPMIREFVEKQTALNCPRATIVFADLENFAELNTQLSAKDSINVLNKVIVLLDSLVGKYRLLKVKTTGTMYLAVAGIPIESPIDALSCVQFALDALDGIRVLAASLNLPIRPQFGVNTGFVVAGCLHTSRISFDLYGDAVNVAHRMMLHGIPGGVQVSGSTLRALPQCVRSQIMRQRTAPLLEDPPKSFRHRKAIQEPATAPSRSRSSSPLPRNAHACSAPNIAISTRAVDEDAATRAGEPASPSSPSPRPASEAATDMGPPAPRKLGQSAFALRTPPPMRARESVEPHTVPRARTIEEMVLQALDDESSSSSTRMTAISVNTTTPPRKSKSKSKESKPHRRTLAPPSVSSSSSSSSASSTSSRPPPLSPRPAFQPVEPISTTPPNPFESAEALAMFEAEGGQGGASQAGARPAAAVAFTSPTCTGGDNTPSAPPAPPSPPPPPPAAGPPANLLAPVHHAPLNPPLSPVTRDPKPDPFAAVAAAASSQRCAVRPPSASTVSTQASSPARGPRLQPVMRVTPHHETPTSPSESSVSGSSSDSLAPKNLPPGIEGICSTWVVLPRGHVHMKHQGSVDAYLISRSTEASALPLFLESPRDDEEEEEEEEEEAASRHSRRSRRSRSPSRRSRSASPPLASPHPTSSLPTLAEAVDRPLAHRTVTIRTRRSSFASPSATARTTRQPFSFAPPLTQRSSGGLLSRIPSSFSIASPHSFCSTLASPTASGRRSFSDIYSVLASPSSRPIAHRSRAPGSVSSAGNSPSLGSSSGQNSSEIEELIAECAFQVDASAEVLESLRCSLQQSLVVIEDRTSATPTTQPRSRARRRRGPRSVVAEYDEAERMGDADEPSALAAMQDALSPAELSRATQQFRDNLCYATEFRKKKLKRRYLSKHLPEFFTRLRLVIALGLATNIAVGVVHSLIFHAALVPIFTHRVVVLALFSVLFALTMCNKIRSVILLRIETIAIVVVWVVFFVAEMAFLLVKHPLAQGTRVIPIYQGFTTTIALFSLGVLSTPLLPFDYVWAKVGIAAAIFASVWAVLGALLPFPKAMLFVITNAMFFTLLMHAVTAERAMRLVFIQTDQQLHQFQQLKRENERYLKLLEGTLPATVLDSLRTNPTAISQKIHEATVMFVNFVKFTEFCTNVPCVFVVQLLDEIYGRFDRVCKHHSVTPVSTIGDSYFCGSGVVHPQFHHIENCVAASFEILRELRRFNHTKGIQLSVRIGLSTGEAFSGVLGVTRFTYDVWGPCVTEAKRLEAGGAPNRVLISKSIKEKLPAGTCFLREGPIVGKRQAYFLYPRK